MIKQKEEGLDKKLNVCEDLCVIAASGVTLFHCKPFFIFTNNQLTVNYQDPQLLKRDLDQLPGSCSFNLSLIMKYVLPYCVLDGNC